MAALCHQLNITYTDLLDQPAWWVESYQLYLSGKALYENTQAKRAERKAHA